MEHYDCVIWMGDHNYRLGPSQDNKVVNMLMANNMWDIMLQNC
jgi:hypothetical protein